MRSNNTIYDLTLLGVISAFVVLSITIILNLQTVYSENPKISFLDVNTSSSVSKFSVASWFKTSNDYKSDAFIVNKAGDGGNMNYGIWMTDNEKVAGGFETTGGNPMFATSPLSYSDGKWHYAVVTFDGSVVSLYVDGVQVATKKTSGSPDNGGDNPIRVGADSKAVGDYFQGNVDEVRVWRVALTPDQVNDAYHGTFDTKYQEVYLDFSNPIVLLNQTALNQTALNQTALNQTALNQTALNQTALNQTALNQTALNQTASNRINGTTANETTTQEINGTAANETEIQGINQTFNERSTTNNVTTNNGTGNFNGTTENIQAFNETEIGNQTSIPKLSEENALPNAFDQSISIDQNGRTDITLAADDDNKDRLQYDITADPLHGSLDNFNKEKGTVTYIPQKDYSGKDKFSFRAIDDKGGQSEPANVDIQINTVSELNETKNTGLTNSQEKISNETSTEQTGKTNSVQETNQPPKADAGDDQYAKVSTQVKLDGGKSSDDDGKIVSYKWEQTDGPKVNIKKADVQTATFDVPDSAADSKLTFKLTVVDDKDASGSDDVTVQVGNEIPAQTDTNNQQTDINKQTDTNNQQSKTEEQIKVQNVPPKADAGDNQNVEVNSEVKLDGGKSSDDDGKIVSYKWEQTDGPKVDLKNADEKTATFVVPDSAADSKLTFKLTVVDDKDASSSDDVSIEVGKISKDVSSTNDDSSTKDASNNKGK
jgi:hypothetical protein